MTETAHTRSRRASLGGLVVQLLAFGGTLTLALTTRSVAMLHLAWYVLGGVPIWFDHDSVNQIIAAPASASP